MKNIWGWELLLDLKDCNAEKIRDKNYIYSFIIELCDEIDMKRFKEPILERFGETEEVAGHSFTQLIYTSSIVGHFVESTNKVFLDIFSCKKYDVKKTIDFCKKYFEADSYDYNYLRR